MNNWELMKVLNDPGNYFEHLESELAELEKNNGSAIIIAHIPIDGCPHAFGERFRGLSDRY